MHYLHAQIFFISCVLVIGILGSSLINLRSFEIVYWAKLSALAVAIGLAISISALSFKLVFFTLIALCVAFTCYAYLDQKNGRNALPQMLVVSSGCTIGVASYFGCKLCGVIQ